jgi:hypothetical protein
MTQTSPVCRELSASLNAQSRGLKLLMIYNMHRIPSVHHVTLSFSLLQPSAPKVDHTDLHCSSSTSLHSNDTSHPSLSSSNRVSSPHSFSPPVVYRKHPIWDFGDPRFMFYVYGFDLSDRICLVSIVMFFVAASYLGCVFSTILDGPPYIPFCL